MAPAGKPTLTVIAMKSPTSLMRLLRSTDELALL